MSDDFGFFLLLMSNGILIGLMYSLIALGFVLVYKATDAINFAQGEFVMIAGLRGGRRPRRAAARRCGSPSLLGLGAMVGFGFALERVMLRKLIGRPVIAVVMATIGLAVDPARHRPARRSAPGPSRCPLPIPDEPFVLGPAVHPAHPAPRARW